MTTPVNPSPDEVVSAIGEIIQSLAQSGREEAATLLRGMLAHVDFDRVLGAVDTLNPEHFHLFLTHATNQMAKALLDSKGQHNPRAQFLFTHYRFVEGHLKEIYQTHEGGACCADKSRWATRALLRHFANDQPIVLDLAQQYTFHLPKSVLNTQDQLVQMFEGLYALYYGNPTKYLEALLALKEQARLLQNTGT